MKVNYQKKLDQTLQALSRENRVPSLFLHSCCAPCSSYVLEYLSDYFKITVFYYNPNIAPEEEYRKRVEEQKRFILEYQAKHKIEFIEGEYDSGRFYDAARGLEQEKEGGRRCYICYEMRLREAARMAKTGGYDFFSTTLSVSPYKNAAWLNEIGGRVSEEFGIEYLYSDFKKKDGYKRSVFLADQFGLYRQDYCGCLFSKREVSDRQNEGR